MEWTSDQTMKTQPLRVRLAYSLPGLKWTAKGKKVHTLKTLTKPPSVQGTAPNPHHALTATNAAVAWAPYQRPSSATITTTTGDRWAPDTPLHRRVATCPDQQQLHNVCAKCPTSHSDHDTFKPMAVTQDPDMAGYLASLRHANWSVPTGATARTCPRVVPSCVMRPILIPHRLCGHDDLSRQWRHGNASSSIAAIMDNRT